MSNKIKTPKSSYDVFYINEPVQEKEMVENAKDILVKIFAYYIENKDSRH